MRLMLAASALGLLAGPAATQPNSATPPADQAAPQSGQPAAAAKPLCRNVETRDATVLPAPPPPASRLDELPPGNLELAVHRQVEDCVEPVIVRYGVGNGFGRR